jgi:hypothetical protein
MSIYTTTYLNNISALGLLADRTINDTLTLPYTFRDIKIKPNAVLTSNLFNEVIEKIDTNFLYLISYGKIPTTILPINNTHYLSGTFTEDPSSFNYFPARCTISEFTISNADWSPSSAEPNGVYTTTEKLATSVSDRPYFQPSTGNHMLLYQKPGTSLGNFLADSTTGSWVIKTSTGTHTVLFYNHSDSKCPPPAGWSVYPSASASTGPLQIIPTSTNLVGAFKQPTYEPAGSLTSVVDISFIAREDGKTAGVISNTTTLSLLSAETRDNTTINSQLLSESNKITAIGQDTFTNIKALDTKNDELFILNDYSIYKYNISGITRDDLSSFMAPIEMGRYLIDSFGGSGDVSDNIKFANPINISIYGNNLYVLDQKTDYTKTFIKKYDLNLNLQSIHNISNNFYQIPTTDIMASADSVFVLSPSGRLVKYDIDLKNEEIIKLKDIEVLSTGDNYKRLESSKENPNIFYIMSNKNIFKKFKTKPLTTIGKFESTRYSPGNHEYAGISITDAIAGTDELFVSDTNNGVIYRFLESSSYQNSFYDTYESQIFPLSSLQINPQENTNNFTFNKAFSKLLFNHFILKENAKAKFQGSFDSTGALNFDGIKYPTETEYQALHYNSTLDNYVGINEIVLSETINRPIYEIYKLQEYIADFLQARKTGSSPINSVVVEL